MKYEILIRFPEVRKTIHTDDILIAFNLFHSFVEQYDDYAVIDLVDLRTGEVFQTNMK